MEAHYSTLLDHHPDAGSSLEDFVDALVIDIAPLLMSQPGIGRRYFPAESLLSALVEEFARLELASAGRLIELRRWIHGQFELLYAVAGDPIVLVSARDQQQDFS